MEQYNKHTRYQEEGAIRCKGEASEEGSHTVIMKHPEVLYLWDARSLKLVGRYVLAFQSPYFHHVLTNNASYKIRQRGGSVLL